MNFRPYATQKRPFKTHVNISLRGPITNPDNRRFWHPKIEQWPIKKLRRSKRTIRR